MAGVGIRGIVEKSKIFSCQRNIYFKPDIFFWLDNLQQAYTNGDSAAGQAALVCTSTGVAFATFICILTYHTYLHLKSTKLHLYFRRHQIERGDGREREIVVGSMESAVDAPLRCPPTVTIIELREPLLTDN